MSRRIGKRRAGQQVRGNTKTTHGLPSGGDRCEPLFELTPLEQRVLLSLTPSCYGLPTIPAGATPTYNLTLNATGDEVNSISQWQIDWGDTPNGNPDIQTISAPPSYPYTLSHTYPGSPGDYPITATAFTATSSYSTELGPDQRFGSGGRVQVSAETANSVAVQGDGKVVVVGSVSGGGTAVTRLSIDGSLDTAFGSNGTATCPLTQANAVAIDPNGNVIVAGSANVGGQPKLALARFTPSGVLDTTFGNNGVATSFASGTANATVIQPNGEIVVAGTYNNSHFVVARFDPSQNAWDSTFGTAGTVTETLGMLDYTTSVLLQNVNGAEDIVVGGYDLTETASCVGNFVLMRLSPAGALDSSFGSGGVEQTNYGTLTGNDASWDTLVGIGLQPDGQIVAGGWFGSATQQYQTIVERFTANGQLDSSFGGTGYMELDDGYGNYGDPSGMTVQPDGKIILVGQSGEVIRLAATGGFDPTFGNNGIYVGSTSGLATVAVQNDGRIVVAAGTTISRYDQDNAVLVGGLATPAMPVLSGADQPIGSIAIGADGGDPASLGYSGAVRYADGTVTLTTSDVDPAEAGLISGHTRTWSDMPGLNFNPANGENVVPSQWPVLLRQQQGTMVVVTGGSTVRWFDEAAIGSACGGNCCSGSSYLERFGGQDSLYSDGGDGFFFDDSAGNHFHFAPFASSTDPSHDAVIPLQDLTDPGGNVTSFLYYPSGQVQQINRTRASDNAILEQLTYSYTGTQLTAVEMSRRVNGALTAVRSVTYEYYDGSNVNGANGDLARATVTENGVAVDHDLYRYDQSTGLLLFAVAGAAYEQLAAQYGAAALAPSSTAVSNAQLAPYANYAFTYYGPGDPSKIGKVETQTLNGGKYKYTYDYLEDTGSTSLNGFRYKTLETLPDGNTNTIYTNYAGEPLLKVFTDVTGTGSQWATAYAYDGRGRLTLEADPAAVANAGAAGNVSFLTDGTSQWFLNTTGAEHLTDYYGPDSFAVGYQHDTYLRQGNSGTGILQSTTTYTSQESGEGVFIFPVASSTVYRNADGTGAETTTYTYTWQPNTVQLQSETIAHPIVTPNPTAGFPSPNGENGDGTADAKTMFFDSFGRVTWTKDADGFIQYSAYDDATGALIKSIVDVNMQDTTDFTNPPSWTTPSGGGLELITRITVDGFGRPTAVTDPNGNTTTMLYVDTAAIQEVVTTPPSVSSGDNPPISVTRDDRQHGDTYTFTVQPGSTQVASMSQSHISPQGELSYDKKFFTLTGVTYQLPTNSTAPGTLTITISNANTPNQTPQWYRTDYGYDTMGRQNRVAQDVNASPASDTAPLNKPQISRTVYDSLGRSVSSWTGTDDSGWVSASDPGSNMVEVTSTQYDNGAVGDGNVTQITQYPGDGQPSRVTLTEYDWRDRSVETEAGAGAATGTHPPITYSVYDNLDEVIEKDTYDGDGIVISGSTNGVPNRPNSSLLRAKTVTSYDERGRAYRVLQYSVDQTSGTVGSALVTNTFYDRRGDVMAVFAPGGLVTKSFYDGAGRVVAKYTSDGGAVHNGGTADLTYSGAGSTNHDVVLEETQTEFDADGNPTFVLSYERHHDFTGFGQLGYGDARISFIGNYYDAADRLVTTVDWGNNGDDGQSFLSNGNYARPLTPPGRDPTATNGWDQWLQTDYQYDANGYQAIITDPRGIEARTYYDGLGRKIGVTQAYTGSLSVTDPESDPAPGVDTDNKVETQYNGLDQVTQQTSVAYNPDPNATGPLKQTTIYTYGVTKGGKIALNSNALLASVTYGLLPNAPSGIVDEMTTSGYDALGEPTDQTMRDGTTHDYAYDVLGRKTQDLWAGTEAWASGQIDTTATELDYGYDTLGRGTTFITRGNGPLYTAGNPIISEVQRTYDDLGNMIQEDQNHGASGTDYSVQYIYDINFGANYTRLQETVYPAVNGNTRNISYVYGYVSNVVTDPAAQAVLDQLNNSISRVGYVVDGDVRQYNAGNPIPTSIYLETYDYLGLSQVVARDYRNATEDGRSINIRLSVLSSDTYIGQPDNQVNASGGGGTYVHDDAGSQDPYDGLDRFGRYIEYDWTGGNTQLYAYDADGNPLYAIDDTSPSINYAWRSTIFHEQGAGATTAYDHLNRMKAYYRGQIDSTFTSVTQGPVYWYNDGSGYNTIPVDERSNPAVSLSSTAATQGAYDITSSNEDIQYDHVYQKPVPDLTQQYDLGTTLDNPRRDLFVTYDAWGRMVTQAAASLVLTSGTTYHYDRPFTTTFAYDALGREISETHTYIDPYSNDSVSSTLGLYQDTAGDTIEEVTRGSNATPFYAQYVYSASGHGVMIERDNFDDNSQPQRTWIMQGPDNSTWTVRINNGTAYQYGEFLYTPDGHVTSISNHQEQNGEGYTYDFSPDSQYGVEYLWHGGRYQYDRDLNTPTTTDTLDSLSGGNYFIYRINGLYNLGGVMYDSGEASPMKEDPYAFYLTSGGTTGLDAHAYSKRTYVQTAMTHAGTEPTWFFPMTSGIRDLLSDVEWVGNFFGALPGAIVDTAKSNFQAIGNSVKQMAYTFADVANDALYSYTFYSRYLDSGGTDTSGGISFYNGHLSDIEKSIDSGAVNPLSWSYISQSAENVANAVTFGVYDEVKATGQYLSGSISAQQYGNRMAVGAFTNFLSAATMPADANILLDRGMNLGGLQCVGRQIIEGAGEICFTAGTRILVPKAVEDRPDDQKHFQAGGATCATIEYSTSSTRLIEDIKAGDFVLARDDDDPSQPLLPRRVIRISRREVSELRVLTFRSSDGSCQTIRCTDEHPFWVDGVGWTPACDMVQGVGVTEADGHVAHLVESSLEVHDGAVRVYNFEVEHSHTYFVSGSESAPLLWVHNWCQIQRLAWDSNAADAARMTEVSGQIGEMVQTAIDELNRGGVGQSRYWAPRYQALRSAGASGGELALVRGQAINSLVKYSLRANPLEGVLMGMGSIDGARALVSGRLLVPDFQVALPSGAWGVIDITTEAEALTKVKYLGGNITYNVNILYR